MCQPKIQGVFLTGTPLRSMENLGQVNLRRRRSAQIHLTQPRLTFLYLEFLGGVPVKKHPVNRSNTLTQVCSSSAGVTVARVVNWEVGLQQQLHQQVTQWSVRAEPVDCLNGQWSLCAKVNFTSQQCQLQCLYQYSGRNSGLHLWFALVECGIR